MTDAEAQYKEEAMQMTIKEAIDYLQPIADNSDVPKHVEALRVALDALIEVERLREEIKAEKWIPVTERLPDKNEKCLCCYCFGEYYDMPFISVLDYYATEEIPHFQHTRDNNDMKVTHWMPLPKPPVIDQA